MVFDAYKFSLMFLMFSSSYASDVGWGQSFGHLVERPLVSVIAILRVTAFTAAKLKF